MQAGLHSPEEFKDNCGFGLIAHMQGQPSHELLETAIESLTCMTHRGGIAADGKTGDGCGILMKKPDSFLRQVAKDLWGVNLAPQFAIGVVFLPVDTKKSESTKAVVEAELLNVGLGVTGWRTVPVDSSVCGPIALESLPSIQHVFIETNGKSEADVATALYVARKKSRNCTG
jgi:glutamate synthase (NADPH/NADH) large chain